MTEQDPHQFFTDERFQTLRVTQEALARRGFLFCPIPREHTEALVTGPLLHRIHTQVKKRGFANVASKVALTFSGYAADPREVFEIPEVRAYWRTLDADLPELPALLAVLPDLGFNGPGLHLLLLGTIDTVLNQPAKGGYDIMVSNAPQLLDQALQRIRQAGRTYHLPEETVTNLIEQFTRGTRFRL